MTWTPYCTSLPVYRHASDDQARDCGRACAQMLITSLHLGNTSSPPADTVPVPVTQDHLKSQETYESTFGKDGPEAWFTYPDELVGLLNSSPELKALNRAHWKIVHYAASSNPGRARKRILNAIATSLITEGMPAILNLKSSDHWVLVSKVWLDSSHAVMMIRFADPAGGEPQEGGHHTYRDECDTQVNYWLQIESPGLANWSLKIGDNKPDDYKNHCLAIIYEKEDPKPPTRKKKSQHVESKPIVARDAPIQQGVFADQKIRPPAVALDGSPQQAVFTDLRRIADLAGLDELGPLIGPGAQVRVWRVKDIDGSAEEFELAVVSHSHSRRVVHAVCDPKTHQLSHFRVTTQNLSFDSLTDVPQSETLWWSGRLDDNYCAPFFPFRLEIEAGRPRYRRLIDNHQISRDGDLGPRSHS